MPRLLLLLTAAAALALTGCNRSDATAPATATADADLPLVTVYKTPTCGCCVLWVEHMEAAGFTVEEVDVPVLYEVRAEHGVPPTLSSCHTATVGGYVVEGHVPADDVKRLLRERPEGVGISVPGMPIGSPGMEVVGRPAQPYNVVLFGDDGRHSVFARH
jgi:hypothetical protein